MRRLALLLMATACGSGHSGPDGPPPVPPCDYTEASDGTNDKSAEDSGLGLGDETKDLCGTVDPGHFNAATKTVDTDMFRLTLGSPADLLVRVFGGAGVASLGDFSVMIFDDNANPTLLNGGRLDTKLGDHGVFASSLPAGTYDVWVVAKASADIASPIDYKVRILPDAPATRCGQIADPAAYSEAHDNADNLGNDVVDVDFAKPAQFSLTAATTDAPEPTGVTLDADMPVRITGSSANVTGPDEYMDRDTFQLTTGAMTNELALRIDWPAGGADLDAILFAENQMVATGSATRSGTSGDELVTFAVAPSQSYWLWVGAAKGSTSLPAMYDISLCGTNVTN